MRHKILLVSPELFLDFCMFGGNVKIVENALPTDTKFVRAFIDDNYGHGRVGLVIESSSFEEVKEGDSIERIVGPLFEKVYT